MSEFIHAIHDTDGSSLMAGKPGWIVTTEALGSDPNDHSGKDYSRWINQGFSVICRLNNGYYPVGTIPQSQDFQAFATRCKNFVAASPGINVVIIGNEPNHHQERPYGQPIHPTQYAKCFDLCYTEIKNIHPKCKITTAAIAPWDATTTYPGNSIGDWIVYYMDMLNAIQKCDSICLHTYTHGTDPNLISDESKMDPPFDKYHYNFRAYVDFLAYTPVRFAHVPIYITETDQIVPWADRNVGWVQEAYEEIDFWNHTVEEPKIHCLALYRSSRDDQWSFADKEGVKDDFRQAVQKGYQIPSSSPPIHPPPDSGSNPNPPSTPPPAQDNRNIDPILIARGVNFDFVTPPKGEGYWKITNAIHLNEQEADRVGPDHHILGSIMRDGREIADIPFIVTWPSGHTEIRSKKSQISTEYNYDFPMTSSLNEFSIWVDDGNHTDSAHGIGMGAYGNPSIHTSTWIDWKWTISSGDDIPIPIPPPNPNPIPPPPELHIMHPLPGSFITQHFYQNPDDYARFGMPGHNGTDLGGREEGTPVRSVGTGIVAYVDFDRNYGNYIRIAYRHPSMMCYVMYCHLQRPSLLSVGDTVGAGEEVGKLGMTGNATGVHLHIEVRLMEIDGTYKEDTPMPKGRLDPETFFAERDLKL